MTHCCISEFSKENLADSRDVRVFVSQQWTKRVTKELHTDFKWSSAVADPGEMPGPSYF